MLSGCCAFARNCTALLLHNHAGAQGAGRPRVRLLGGGVQGRGGARTAMDSPASTAALKHTPMAFWKRAMSSFVACGQTCARPRVPLLTPLLAVPCRLGCCHGRRSLPDFASPSPGLCRLPRVSFAFTLYQEEGRCAMRTTIMLDEGSRQHDMEALLQHPSRRGWLHALGIPGFAGRYVTPQSATQIIRSTRAVRGHPAISRRLVQQCVALHFVAVLPMQQGQPTATSRYSEAGMIMSWKPFLCMLLPSRRMVLRGWCSAPCSHFSDPRS